MQPSIPKDKAAHGLSRGGYILDQPNIYITSSQVHSLMTLPHPSHFSSIGMPQHSICSADSLPHEAHLYVI
jgi:hypothetical protein